jgi:hypothetical protein
MPEEEQAPTGLKALMAFKKSQPANVSPQKPGGGEGLFGMPAIDTDSGRKANDKPMGLMARSTMGLKESLLKKVAGEAGIKKVPIKIKETLLPKEPDLCEILLDRRLMYDVSLSVREAMAVLIIFIFEIHLPDLVEYFLASTETDGIGVLEEKSKDPASEKKRRDMEKKAKEKIPENNP